MIDMTLLIMAEFASFLNGSLLPSIVAVVGSIYFGWKYCKANKIANDNRKKVQQEIINKATKDYQKRDYFVACAGSMEPETSRKISGVDIKEFNLCDSQGKLIDTSLFDCYIVSGDSMKYAGINDNDFILVSKDFNVVSLKEFPEILVIKYREEVEDRPIYKVRRAWYKGSIEDDLSEVAKKIMHMSKFQKLTRQNGYKGEDWMIRDLIGNRLEKYKLVYFQDGLCPESYKEVVISTTFDSVKKEIHFSIHPLCLIKGVVQEAYSINLGKI